MWSVNYKTEMPNLDKKYNKLVWQAESTHWYTIAKMCTFYHFYSRALKLIWQGVRCCWHQLPEKGGMGQLPIKLLKTDEVPKTCIAFIWSKNFCCWKVFKPSTKGIKV